MKFADQSSRSCPPDIQRKQGKKDEYFEERNAEMSQARISPAWPIGIVWELNHGEVLPKRDSTGIGGVRANDWTWTRCCEGERHLNFRIGRKPSGAIVVDRRAIPVQGIAALLGL